MTMEPRTYRHPKPLLKRLVEAGALLMFLLMLLCAVGLVALPLLGAPGGFVVAALLLVILSAPVLMLTAYAPAVTLHQQGITLHPLIWKDRHVPWEAIRAVKIYPLLPSQDEEATRRHFIGKRAYKPAQGIMLVIPHLPAQYRIVGFLAGTGARPTIALTNRAHADYDHLLETILRLTDPATHDSALFQTEA